MAELLKLAEFLKDHHVAEGQIRAGGVDAELHAQGLAGLEALEDLQRFHEAGFNPARKIDLARVAGDDHPAVFA